MKSSSPGYDDISPIVFKHVASIISAPLAHMVNISLKCDIFPDQLKETKVIPLFKTGDRGNINNYRPISILPAFTKIFLNFLMSNHLLTEQQHGFRAHHSTESAILQFVNKIYKCLELKHVIGIFIALSKVFDSLDHKVLL